MVKIFLPFIILIVLEFLFFFGFTKFSSILEEKIAFLESGLKQKESQILTNLKQEGVYYVFSQADHLRRISENKKSVNQVVANFKARMPKFIFIDSFSYDNDKKEIEFSFKINNWRDYIRIANYFKNHPDFVLKSSLQPQISDDKLINLRVTLGINDSFYK